MKKQLLLILGLFFGIAHLSHGQVAILSDTAYGGQLQMAIQASLVRPDSSTIIYRSEWSNNAAYVPLFADTFDTTTNMTGAQDTILISAIVTIPLPGTYHYRFYAIDTTNADTVIGFDYTLVVVPLIVRPIISTGTATATTDGANAPYGWDAGNDSAWITFIVNPWDSSDNASYFYDLDSIHIGPGTGSTNRLFTSITQPQHNWAYKIRIRNSVGDSTSAKHGVHTLPSGGNPWIGLNPDSADWDTTHIATYWSVVTNGTATTTRTYIALTFNGAAIDSVTQSLAGAGGITNIVPHFSSLLPNTDYYLWTCVDPGNLCSNRYLVRTDPIPIRLSFAVDSAFAQNITTARGMIRDTSVVAGSLQVLVTPQNDPLFSNPVASPLASFSQGVNVMAVDFPSPIFISTGTGFVIGDTYLMKVQGYNDNFEGAESPVYSFVFMPNTTMVIERVPNTSMLFARSTLIATGEKPLLVHLFAITGALALENTLHPGEQLNLTGRVSPGLYVCRWTAKDGSFGIKKMVVE